MRVRTRLVRQRVSLHPVMQRTVCALLTSCLIPIPLWAASATVVNRDNNYGIHVEDAYPDSASTRLVFYTSPDHTQAQVRDRCTANFYILDLKPGLENTAPQAIASDFCSSLGMSATALDNGAILIIAGDSVQSWRAGEGKTGEWKFSDSESLKVYGPGALDSNTPMDVNRAGGIIIASGLVPNKTDVEGPAAIVTALNRNGLTRWQYAVQAPGVQLNVVHAWSTADGGALVYVTAKPRQGNALPDALGPPGALVAQQERLYRLSATGAPTAPITLASVMMPDPSRPLRLEEPGKKPASLAELMQQQQALSLLEAVDQIHAHTQAEGVTDVLLRRGSSDKSRSGSVYYRIGVDGETLGEVMIEASLTSQGVHNWTDFAVSGDDLLLYGVTASSENRLPQGYLSEIDVSNGRATTLLAPLNALGLAAARSARDEQVQNLEHNPGQQPVLLTSLAGKPLLVSLIRQSRRPAIQLDELSTQAHK